MLLKWFPFPLQDYCGHTMHFDTLCHGAMATFMACYWQNGSLPASDEDRRALLGDVTNDDWQHINKVFSLRCYTPRGEYLAPLFDKDWTNPYLDRVRAECETRYVDKAKRLRSHSERRPAAEDWLIIRTRIFKRDDFTCSYCGVRGGDLECDHIVPVCQGGSNEDENLTTSCYSCNRAKGPRTIEQWRAVS